ncbi:MAG: hypothetical protein M0D55_07610 [Elusimicrobiota bacterium]|nr:MAG: hypothetical protein M0D55_07610 [Elusimicrobiota bacterium]
MALLDWSKIGPNSREALARRGIGEAEWASLRLARRFSVMRGVLEQKAGEIMDVPLGHPAYVAKYEQSFRMLAGLMSTEEIIVHNEALERAKRFAAGLRAAEKAAAAGSGAARALEQARKSGDLDEAEGLLDRARGQLKLAPAAAVKPVYDLNPEETHRLTGRLTDAVVRALGATEIGRELIASVREMPVTTELRALAGSSGGHYARLPGSGSVVWNTTLMAELLAEIGRSPRGALNDDEALRDAVVLYSQLMAHELTHHRQRLRKAPLTDKHYSTMYTREDEMEANNAQVAFLRQMRAASPGFAARETRLLATGGRFADFMRQAEEHAADPARMNHWLEGSYTRVPTFERAAIRLMAAGGREQQRMAPAVERIEAELFRRRRLSSAERAALEKDGVEEGRAPLSAIKTSVLRRMRAYWADTGRVMIQEAWRIGRETREQIERLAR